MSDNDEDSNITEFDTHYFILLILEYRLLTIYILP
jgi:hypothetical protein